MSEASMPAVILFGKDETEKPHASYFDQTDLTAALKAAELMGMRVLRTDTDQQRALATELPHGRVFASGKAFVPFVAATLYDRLVELAAARGAVAAAGVVVSAMGAENVPTSPAEAPSGAVGRAAPSPGRELGQGVAASAGASAGYNHGESADRGRLAPGSLVLASAEPGDGWWESVITAANDDLLTLRWRDWPKEPAFVRRSTQVALLHPQRAHTAGA